MVIIDPMQLLELVLKIAVLRTQISMCTQIVRTILTIAETPGNVFRQFQDIKGTEFISSEDTVLFHASKGLTITNHQRYKLKPQRAITSHLTPERLPSINQQPWPGGSVGRESSHTPKG